MTLVKFDENKKSSNEIFYNSDEEVLVGLEETISNIVHENKEEYDEFDYEETAEYYIEIFYDIPEEVYNYILNFTFGDSYHMNELISYNLNIFDFYYYPALDTHYYLIRYDYVNLFIEFFHKAPCNIFYQIFNFAFKIKLTINNDNMIDNNTDIDDQNTKLELLEDNFFKYIFYLSIPHHSLGWLFYFDVVFSSLSVYINYDMDDLALERELEDDQDIWFMIDLYIDLHNIKDFNELINIGKKHFKALRL